VQNPEATAEALTADGWLCTGDIGRWNPNGTLSIIDRKKNMFKLSQGEYVAAEKIEQVYAKANLVAQNWVYGNSYKPFVLAVIVPNAQRVYEWLKAQGKWDGKEPFSMRPEWAAEFKVPCCPCTLIRIPDADLSSCFMYRLTPLRTSR